MLGTPVEFCEVKTIFMVMLRFTCHLSSQFQNCTMKFPRGYVACDITADQMGNVRTQLSCYIRNYNGCQECKVMLLSSLLREILSIYWDNVFYEN